MSLFLLFCPPSVVVYNACFSIYVAISKHCKSRLFTSTISPNSYFTGLPLLIQPSELCIIHSQHVVAMKCRNAFSSIINNSCSENGEQNAKWEAGLKREGKQLNQISQILSFSFSFDWRDSLQDVMTFICICVMGSLISTNVELLQRVSVLVFLCFVAVIKAQYYWISKCIVRKL